MSQADHDFRMDPARIYAMRQSGVKTGSAISWEGQRREGPPILLTIVIILGVLLLGMGAAGMVDGLRHPIRAENVR